MTIDDITTRKEDQTFDCKSILINSIKQMKYFSTIVLILMAFGCVNADNKATGTVDAEHPSSEGILDSCLVWSNGDDPSKREVARRISSMILEEALEDSTKAVDEKTFQAYLSKADTILNRWHVSMVEDGGYLFEHEVICEDGSLWIAMLLDESGKCDKLLVDYPNNASSKFAVGFTNNTELDESESLPFIENIFVLDDKMQNNGGYYALLDSTYLPFFLKKLYVYFSYADENGELYSTRQNLSFFHQQYENLFK